MAEIERGIKIKQPQIISQEVKVGIDIKLARWLA